MHAGIGLPMAKLIGDAAGKLEQRLLVTESGRGQDPAVSYVEFGYDADTGRTRPEDPAIQKADRISRDDAVGELLDARRNRTIPAARGTPAARDRDLSPGALQDVQPTRAPRAGAGIARPVLSARSKPADRGNRLRGVAPDRKRRSRGGRGGVDGL